MGSKYFAKGTSSSHLFKFMMHFQVLRAADGSLTFEGTMDWETHSIAPARATPIVGGAINDGNRSDLVLNNCTSFSE